MGLSPLFLLEQSGNIGVVTLPLGVGLQALKEGYQSEAIGFGIVAIVQQIILALLKGGTHSARPFPNHLSLDSFPSGHTAVAFLSLGFVMALDWLQRKESNKPYKSVVFKIIILAAALLVAISRYACHKHWLMDIAGGVLLGLFNGAMAIYIPRKLNFKESFST